MRAWPQAPGRLLRDGMSLLLPLTEGPPRPLGCPFPLVPIPPAPAPLRYRRRTQLRSRGRPASSRLCGKPSLPGGSACAERLRRGRLSSEKSSLQPPAVGRRHAVVISSSVSLVRSCRATSVWGIQPTGPPTRRAQCLLVPRPKSWPYKIRSQSLRDSELKETKPSLYPVLQDTISEEFIFPPPYQPLPTAPLAEPVEPDGEEPVPEEPVPVPEGGMPTRGPCGGDMGRVNRQPSAKDLLTQLSSPCIPQGPLMKQDSQCTIGHCPLVTSITGELRMLFSENPRDLLNLLDTVLFTHQPTWDDCQQLLQVLFTTEERERGQVEAQKLVLGDSR
nr:uncharacterized protein LOC108391123 isoform X2 [Manis javanica]